MKKTLLLILLWFQIRGLEALVDGQAVTMPLADDVDSYSRLTIRHASLREEVRQLKSEYRRIKRGSGIKALQIA